MSWGGVDQPRRRGLERAGRARLPPRVDAGVPPRVGPPQHIHLWASHWVVGPSPMLAAWAGGRLDAGGSMAVVAAQEVGAPGCLGRLRAPPTRQLRLLGPCVRVEQGRARSDESRV